VRAERLIPVRDFGEIRAGMILVVEPGECCGGRHRFMATTLRPSVPIRRSDGTEYVGPVWVCFPPPSCVTDPRRTGGVEREGCREGRVFRVDEGMSLENAVVKVVVEARR
jgi:hypothetical protein